jgi:hypothetical protein
MLFLFSTRNGINCVESGFVHREHVDATTLTRYATLHETQDYFVQCCHEWKRQVDAMVSSKRYLESRGASIVETTLEAVTNDQFELRRVWDRIVGDWPKYGDHARRRMKHAENTRVNTDAILRPTNIWDRWSESERRAFQRICGATQAQLGYQIPG